MDLLKLRDHQKKVIPGYSPRDSRIIEISSFKFAIFSGVYASKGELCWDSDEYPHDISSFEQRFKPLCCPIMVVVGPDSQWSKYPQSRSDTLW